VPVQQFAPAPGMSQNFVRVYGTEVVGSLRPAFGVFVNYAYRPLVVTLKGDGGTEQRFDLIRHQWAADLMAAFAIGPSFQLGAALPVTFHQEGEREDMLPNNSLAARALGDVRLVPKWRVFGEYATWDPEGWDDWSLALLAVLTYPSGSKKDLQGDQSVTGEPKVVVEWRPIDRLRTGLNLGYVVRKQQGLYNVDVGNELTAGIGASFGLVEDVLEIIGETAARIPADPDSAFSWENSPVEMHVAARLRLFEWHTLTVGVGPGLTDGYGAPTVRVYAGYAFDKQELPDRDGDGIPDRDDDCPDDPEDFDQFEDEDGCPDTDNDQDGILDVDDDCPNDPEDLDGIEDEDGCPEEEDAAAAMDAAMDECPQGPEDFDGFEDEDGCRDPDNDQDGFPDEIDKCPDEPEIWNQVEDDDGCPDEGRELVRVTPTKVEILERVHFEFDKAVIKPRSYPILKLVAAVLKANPRITRFRVEGHTDSKGTDPYNLELSQARAASVASFLVDHGISANMLEAVGYGESVPIATNMTDDGRALNRRVEFTILEVDGRPVEQVPDAPPVYEAPPPTVDEMPPDAVPENRGPADSAPALPVPEDAVPVDPVPVDPAPVDDLPVDPAPVDDVPAAAGPGNTFPE